MTENEIKVLLVEGDSADADLLQATLRRASASQVKLTHVERFSEALQRLGNDGADVVLLALSLPDAQGLDAVRQMHAAVPGVPLIVLAGPNDELIAVQALQEGAQDYLFKGRIDHGLLLRSLRYAIERHRLNATLRSLSLADDLTGLHNRRGFLTLAEQQVKQARRTGKGFLLILADLDGLKQINETFGHQEGNQALAETANVLKDSFRQSDILSRLGGDEFGVLAADASEGSAEVVRNRLQQKIAARNQQPNRRYLLSLSVGIVAYDPVQPRSLENLMEQADARMQEQKRNRRASAGRSPLARK